MMVRPNRFLALMFLGGCILWLMACTRPAGVVESTLLPPLALTASPSLPAESAAVTPAPSLTPSGSESVSQPVETKVEERYAVAFLSEGEILNVRSEAGVTHDIVATLAANARDLRVVNREQVEDMPWMQVELTDGVTGWVSGLYLALQVPAPQVCNDPQVGTLLDGFVQAVRTEDGTAFARLVSPTHGLVIHHNVWNLGLSYSDPQVLAQLFSSTVDYDWGYTAEGEPLIGPFGNYILPQLQDVLLQSHSRHCNTLEQGVASGQTDDGTYWPYDYRSLNYVALYRPAPAEDDTDWRTWVVGLDYVDGKPYIAVLIPFTY
jgi:hypothetical protein